MRWRCGRSRLIRWGKFLLWYISCIVFFANLTLFLHFNGLYMPQGQADLTGYADQMRLQVVNRTFPNGTHDATRTKDAKLLAEGFPDLKGPIHGNPDEKAQEQKFLDLKDALDGLNGHGREKAPKPSVKKAVAIIAKAPVNIKRAPPKTVPTNDPELERQYFMKKDHVVNPFPHKYVITPHDMCDSQTFLMIIVHSFHPYSDKRMAIRETWGGVAAGRSWPNVVLNDTIRLVFMLGTHKQSGFNDKIRDESDVYKDIVQGDFIDDYKNMTLKSLLGLKWMREQCPQARFLLKSDDDMMINIPYLLQVLHSAPSKWTIMGPLNRGSKVYRTGKWKVTKEQYPFYAYPQYEAGAAYVFTCDIIEPLLDTAKYVPPIHVDDVYITGILGKILNLNHAIQQGFAYWTNKPPTVCDIVKKRIISGTKMTPKRLTLLWKEIVKGQCKEVPGV